MTNQDKKILTIGGLIAFFLLMAKKSTAAGGASFNYIETALKSFLPEIEGFSAKPIWDVKQWSWGFGTRVPGSVNNPAKNPGGTITKEQAYKEMRGYYVDAFNYLYPKLKRELSANQWAAWLSFAYNLGPGNADNLLPEINSGNDTALFVRWRKYVYAGGVKNQGLINRREKEIALWQKP